MHVFSPTYFLLLGFISGIMMLTTAYLIHCGISRLIADAAARRQDAER